jgi:hypothetical protein
MLTLPDNFKYEDYSQFIVSISSKNTLNDMYNWGRNCRIIYQDHLTESFLEDFKSYNFSQEQSNMFFEGYFYGIERIVKKGDLNE